MSRPRVPGRSPGRMSSSEITAASSPWEFQGRRYELHPLTVNDYGVITEAMRGTIMRRYRDMLEPGMDPAVSQTILDASSKAASRVDVLNLGRGTPAEQAELLQILGQPNILTIILWASLRHNHPQLTRYEVGDWFQPEDLQSLEDAVMEIFRMAGVTIENDAAKPPPAPPGDAEGKEAGADSFRPGGPVPGDHTDHRL